MPLFAKTILLGFSIAAPVGPIGLLCIQCTLSGGRALGLATGLGAATADALYGAGAIFGLGVASGTFLVHSAVLRLVGAVFLAYLGMRTFCMKAAQSSIEVTPASFATAWGSALALTVTNPLTILSFAAMFAALQTGAQRTGPGRPLLPVGVFVGSAAWWLAMSKGVGLLRERLLRHDWRWVNRAAGVLLLGFSAWAVASLGSGR